MKIIRINNLTFLEILSFSFDGESWGELIYSKKHRTEKMNAQKYVVQSGGMQLKTSHLESYELIGDFEVFDTNWVNPIFGIINVNAATVIRISGKEIRLPNGTYEIRTRNTLDLYDKYGDKRWEIVEPIIIGRDSTVNDLECLTIFSTYDSCGSDFNVTNVAHCDYELSVYKDIILIHYHHDCNGRGSNGMEFTCNITLYNNIATVDGLKTISDRRQIAELHEKIWDNYLRNNSAMRIEIPLYPRFDAPDDLIGILETTLKSMSRRMLSEDRIHAPKKIVLIIKGLTQQLEFWEHNGTKINDYKDLLETIDSPLTLNLILKKHELMDFMSLAEAKIVESQDSAILFKLQNGNKILALKNQDDSFDISEVAAEMDKITDAILWSFDLTHEEVLEFDSVAL